jgi:hypothetical protein
MCIQSWASRVSCSAVPNCSASGLLLASAAEVKGVMLLSGVIEKMLMQKLSFFGVDYRGHDIDHSGAVHKQDKCVAIGKGEAIAIRRLPGRLRVWE